MKWYSIAGSVMVLVGLAAFFCVMRDGEPCWSCCGGVKTAKAQLRVVNVLDNAQFHDMHIEGSVSVPYERLQDIARGWNKHDAIVLYCSNYLCSASGAGVTLLHKQGFSNVRAYEGGMAEWYALSKHDVRYRCVGSGLEGYLHDPVERPEQHSGSARVVTAEVLQREMEAAGLLPKTVG